MRKNDLQKPDILTVAAREGIELRQRGRNYWGRCPFHADKTPSFKVSPERQTFHCFGCQEGGDVLDFVMKLHALPFPDALRYLGMTPGKVPLIDRQEQRKRELLRDFRQWTRRRLSELSREIRQCRAIIDMCGWDRLHVVGDVIEDMAEAEQQIETLQNGSDEAKYEIWRAR